MSETSLALRPVQSLKVLDPAKMQLTNAVLKLLSGDMQVAVASDVPDAKAFVIDDQLAFAVLSENGTCMLSGDDSVDHACDVLDKADVMLRHVESSLGAVIDPMAVYPAAGTAFASDDAVVLQIRDRGLTLVLALAPDAEQIAGWVEAAASRTFDRTSLPVPMIVEFEAAKLPMADASHIEGGDMLLLPRRVQAVWHSGDQHSPHPAVLNLQSLKLQSGGAFYDDEETGMSDDNAAESLIAFKVPVTIRLPTQYVDAATLSGLQAGGSLQLGLLVQGLPVELLVGGRRIAAGEIVEIGDNFAVLIDERDALSQATETTGEVDLRAALGDGE